VGEARSGEAVSEVAAELARHLRWLEAAGVQEVPAPALPVEPAATGAHARPTEGAAGRSGPPARAPAPTPPPGQGAPPAVHRAGEKGCGSEALVQVRDTLGDCRRCKLAGGRTTLVFGVGNPHAELVFVGEGPGADEDREGEPFVGKAGQLLTKMIQAMGYQREQVYIANVLKSRPPGNRDPQPHEVRCCMPFLQRQIALIRPRVILCVGRIAAQNLLGTDAPLGRLRGRLHRLEPGGTPLVVTYHPAYLLRAPGEKRKAWSDLLFAREVADGRVA
jgi:DNA polymerase